MTAKGSSTGLTSRIQTEDTAARIALACAGVAGDPSVAIAIDAIGGAARFVAAVHDGEDSYLPLATTTRKRIRTLATGGDVARILNATAQRGYRVLTPRDDNWPTQVGSLGRAAPLVLWVEGDAEHFTRPSIAVTGTTAPSDYGRHMALEFSTGAAQSAVDAGAGWGIDHEAMRAATAMHSPAIAVSSASLDRVHVPEGIVVVSELPPTLGISIRSQRRAKYLLAAITGKTILVEAGLSSGALRTAYAAHAMSRPVGVVPGPVTSPASAGCHDLARRHGVELVTSVEQADGLR